MRFPRRHRFVFREVTRHFSRINFLFFVVPRALAFAIWLFALVRDVEIINNYDRKFEKSCRANSLITSDLKLNFSDISENLEKNSSLNFHTWTLFERFKDDVDLCGSRKLFYSRLACESRAAHFPTSYQFIIKGKRQAWKWKLRQPNVLERERWIMNWFSLERREKYKQSSLMTFFPPTKCLLLAIWFGRMSLNQT